MPKFPSGYTEKTTIADEDKNLIADSAASNTTKFVSFSTIKSWIQSLANLVTTTMITNGAVTSVKLAEAFFRGRYQSNTTNSVVTGYTQQIGWGFIQGSAAQGISETVTFPIAFTAPPIVIISHLNSASTSSGTPTSPSAFTNSAVTSTGASARSITSTSFTVVLRASSNHSTSEYYGYSWIAIGPI